MAAIMANRCW